jgi:eukaryotic-like serine/threonine-protein kinase
MATAVRLTGNTLTDPHKEPLQSRDGDEGPPSAPGEVVLGRYRLERLLGTGGFGAVWKARDTKLKRAVAVKVLPRATLAVPRVRREAVAAARLSHPGIVALHEAGEDEDAAYLVSELAPGRTLAELERDGSLSDRDVVKIGLALCEALEHAHERGVVHRDVKPQNVIVGGTGEGRVKLTDFGVAQLAGDEPLTMTGDILGTLAYMAPEQARGRRTGPEADVYALALVVYEALAGVNPVRAPTPAATLRKVGRPLPPLRRLRRDLPPELCEGIDLALRPRPGERAPLFELNAALARAQDDVDDHAGLLPAAGPAPVAALRGPPARLIGAVAAGALVLAAFAAADPEPPLPAALMGLVAAALVLAAPRAGWLAAAAGTGAWLAASGRPGTAVVVAAAVVLPPLLLPRDGGLWSVPALAPLLGIAGLAGAYPALAGRAGTLTRRAALGLAGGWWLLLADPPGDVPAASAWRDSAGTALGDVLAPLLTSGALVVPALFAVAAACLPWLVRDRALPLALAGAAVWAAALAVASQALGHDLVAGAVAGAVLAVLARLAEQPRAEAI